jgi:hypothetical protein
LKLVGVFKLGGDFVPLIVLVLEFSIFPRRDDDHGYEDETIPHPSLITPKTGVTLKPA